MFAVPPARLAVEGWLRSIANKPRVSESASLIGLPLKPILGLSKPSRRLDAGLAASSRLLEYDFDQFFTVRDDDVVARTIEVEHEPLAFEMDRLRAPVCFRVVHVGQHRRMISLRC